MTKSGKRDGVLPQRKGVLRENDGVLLVGHGTRHAQGADEFLALARGLGRRLAPVPLEPCFLELAKPDIPAALGKLVRRGARRVNVVPLMLLAAGHVKHDIPRAVAAAAAMHPAIEVRERGHLGCHPAILELSRRRFDEALAHLPGARASETHVVLVGRGSHDRPAMAEMHRFAALRRELAPLAELTVAFLAMSAPSLGQALAEAACSDSTTVIVQPHLLFPGELMTQLVEQVQSFAANHRDRHWPERRWYVAQPLGPDALVERAVLDIIRGKWMGSAVSETRAKCGGAAIGSAQLER